MTERIPDRTAEPPEWCDECAPICAWCGEPLPEPFGWRWGAAELCSEICKARYAMEHGPAPERVKALRDLLALGEDIGMVDLVIGPVRKDDPDYNRSWGTPISWDAHGIRLRLANGCTIGWTWTTIRDAEIVDAETGDPEVMPDG